MSKIVQSTAWFWLFALCLVLGCGAGNRAMPRNGQSIRIKGSDTMLLLVQRWAAQFMQEHPAISVYHEGGGSRTGIRALIDGAIDICAASRPWQPDEISALVEKQGSLGISILSARDALSVYLHPDNPVRNLSLAEIKGIFSGAIQNWQEVGGADQRIVAVNRNPNSGTFLFFAEHVLLGEDYSENARTLATTSAVVEHVSQNSGAIGYGGMTYGKNVYHCKINGIEPTPENVRNGTYPIGRYLYLYIAKPPHGIIKTFVDWVLSPKGQRIVSEVGYIPLYQVE